MNKEPSATNSENDEAAFRSLLRAAVEQHAVPVESAERVKPAVEAEWRAMLARRSKFQGGVWPAIKSWLIGEGRYRAVVASFTLLLGSWFLYQALQVTPVGSVETVLGKVRISGGDATYFISEPKSGLRVGQYIETGEDDRVALRLVNGQSLRLDVGSRVYLSAPDKIVLHRGAVYIDSGEDQGRSITVATDYGAARDIGTQFELRVLDKSLRLRVREGKVQFKGEGRVSGEFLARQGEELSLNKAGAVSRNHVKPTDNDWQWVQRLAPAFALDNKTLSEFLKWLTREKGWKLVYKSGDLKNYAERNVLHGSIDGLSFEEALRAVSASAGVQYTLEKGVLTVTRRI